MQFPLIGTSVQLRPFTLQDVPPMHEIYSDPEVMRYVGHGPVRTVAGTEAILRQHISHQKAHGFGFWAVVEREGGTVIGDAGLARTLAGDVEMGYTLGHAWWGRGLATQAGRLSVDAARGPLALPGLRALVEAPNTPSQRVLEKLGFQRRGTTIAFGRTHLVYRLDWSPAAPVALPHS